MAPAKRKRGRPTSRTPDLAEKILRRLEDGHSLLRICEPADMPSRSTVLRWTRADEDFRARYARAREDGLLLKAEEALDIADFGGDVNRDRLKVDTRKWYVSKLLPHVFGDRVAITGAEDGAPIRLSDADAARRIASLLAGAAVRRARGLPAIEPAEAAASDGNGHEGNGHS